MEMIIGGAFQGKLEYARRQYPGREFLDGKECSLEMIKEAEGVYDFQEWIRKEMKEELETGKSLRESKEQVQKKAQELIRENPDLIIISNEIGYGIVPLDAFDREFREATGRICTCLAENASRVTRVIMGIGTVIKGD